MSTRSGKRIHKSFHENVENHDIKEKSCNERKTRSHLLKVNGDILNVSLPATNKRKNYVRYPSDDQGEDSTAINSKTKSSHTKKVIALKERNIDVSETENNDSSNKGCSKSKPVRKNKQNVLKGHNLDISPNEIYDVSNIVLNEKTPLRLTRRTKRFEKDDENVDGVNSVQENKEKKKTKSKKSMDDADINAETEQISKKRSRKKKKGSVKQKCTVIVEDINENKPLMNNSNVSVESFHSASASSPISKKYNETEKIEALLNISLEPKDSIKNNESASEDVSEVNKVDLNEPVSRRSKSTRLTESISENICVEAIDNLNTTYDDLKTLNSTFDRDNSDMSKGPKTRCSSTKKSLDKTFDKLPENIDITKDLMSNKEDSESSIISSDAVEINVTFDKSTEDKSDGSMNNGETKLAENIMNTTPVLIESSMEEDPSPIKLENKDTTPTKNAHSLKREGTFTKDGPDPIIFFSPKRNTLTGNIRTPSKTADLLPAAGLTPYHSNTKVTRNHLMNVTHSLEKSSRKSSLFEPVRMAKVMFCSPVDDPAMSTRKAAKIIKSSMKGSNKSFVFEENERSARPSGRKRSFTQGDAEEVRAKRKRLGDELQHSVDRLSRPRTVSAAGKVSEASTPRKLATPARPRSEGPARSRSEGPAQRGKLPDFAALHQRRFDKMESLDECQARKARRARQLLVPTGSQGIIDKSSPKALQLKSAAKETEAKILTPVKAKQETQKRGYTRFGFKLNLEPGVNPFSITKAKEPKPVQPSDKQLKRQRTLPSLAGTTRKEAAKQLVLREKSSTSLRDIKKNDTRTIIKGVRTNRRFELQMKSRNINV